MLATTDEERIAAMPCWAGGIRDIKTLSGGITNRNFLVTDAKGKYVLCTGSDIPLNHVLRFNEHAASVAAAQLGISPKVHYMTDTALVIAYIPSTTFDAATLRTRLPDVLALLKRVHIEMRHAVRGPVMAYWVFHVIRDNLATLKTHHVDLDYALLHKQVNQLEEAVGRVHMTFCHNDLLPANFLDDGQRLWLIDWDYAGMAAPISDLGSLAANNGLTLAEETWMLENYYDTPLTSAMQKRFLAMKAAAFFKEGLWSLTAKLFSKIDFDYQAYGEDNLQKYTHVWEVFSHT